MLSERRDWTKSNTQIELEAQGWLIATNIRIDKVKLKQIATSNSGLNNLKNTQTQRTSTPIDTTPQRIPIDSIIDKYDRLFKEVIKVERVYDRYGKELDPTRYAAIYVRDRYSEFH